VDDFALWQVLVQTLLEISNLRVIGFASDGSEAIDKAEEFQPDLILMDIGLPSYGGIESAVQIQSLAPRSAILFLSDSSHPAVVRAALNAGGRGYVLRSNAARDLVAGIEAVLGGKRFVSGGLVDCNDCT
jgi:DNA-binding NarL/FixJ family response regulator